MEQLIKKGFYHQVLPEASPRATHSMRGQIIIELLVAFGLAGILLPALLTGLIAARNGKVGQEQRILAVGILREGEEAVRSVRDAGWNKITSPIITMDTPYHWVQGATAWSLVAGSETVGDFTRSIVISDINPADPSLKKITITVNWGDLVPSSTASTLYLTRWKNTSFTDLGTVQPTGTGYGDWCKPTQSLISVNLSRQGVPTSVLAAVSIDGTGNRVFAGTGLNASGPTFTNTKITGVPPNIIATSLGDYNNTKANGIFGDSNYAYIATDSNSEEVTILDLNQYSNPPTNTLYKKVGALDTSGPADADSIYVLGNMGYVTTSDNKDKTLYTFDVTDKTNPHILGSVSLPGKGIKMMVVGTYAYIAISGSDSKMQIVNVLNPASPVPAGTYINSSLPNGRDVFVNAGGNRAYLVTAASATQPEFFILNVEDKAAPVLVNNGTYDTNGMDPYGVTIVPGLRAIIVGHNGHEYQVLVITGDVISSCPNVNNFLDIDSGVNGISSITQADGHAYSYIVTGDTNAELKIIEGGLGGGGPGSNGTFESATLPVLDPGHDVAFNSFTATSDPDLSYKISLKHGAGGSCSSITFSDSDFTSFAPGALPLGTVGSGYTNPGECLRYRVLNAGQGTKPFTVTFNYSP